MTTSNVKQFSAVPFIPSRPVKRRASQACIQCRTRKVRCDFVLQSPAFCTNCRLDGVICEISRCKRRKKHERVRDYHPAPPRVLSPSLTTSTLSTTEVNDASQTDGNRHSPEEDVSAQADSGTTENGSDVHPVAITASHVSPDIGHFEHEASLPLFIKPLTPELDAEDWRYLEKRGCFIFPASDLEKIILGQYTEYVHPLVPILDLDDFIGTVRGSTRKQVSLLLYHAVMCAGLAAVNVDTILKYGYESKPAIRKEYYTKAKLLFDLDADTDRMVACQAAILLISWGSNKHSKDAFHWVGIAISQAYSLKLHKPEINASLSKTEQLFRERLWWTLIMRECDVCLAVGRPPRVWPQGTPLLRAEVFMSKPRGTDFADVPEIGKFRRDPWIQRRLELACIQKAKLALVVYRILRLPRAEIGSASLQLSRKAKIWQLQSELKDWRLQLPAELMATTALNLVDAADRSLHLNVAVLHLKQDMAIIMLHKGEVSVTGWTEYPQHDHDLFEDDVSIDAQGHIKSMRQAAHEITTIHQTLYEQRLTACVPTFGVATLCAAIFVHLLDARLMQESIRTAALDYLNTCLQVLRELGQINETATDIVKIVESAVQTARDFSIGPSGQRPPISHGLGSGQRQPRPADEFPCSTDSYMEGMLADRPRGTPGPHTGTHSGAHVPEPPDLYAPTSQDFLSGMENFFDFELDEAELFLTNAINV